MVTETIRRMSYRKTLEGWEAKIVTARGRHLKGGSKDSKSYRKSLEGWEAKIVNCESTARATGRHLRGRKQR